MIEPSFSAMFWNPPFPHTEGELLPAVMPGPTAVALEELAETSIRPGSVRSLRWSSLAELALLRGAWDRLADGVPFRSWPWMSAWWEEYGREPARELRVLTAIDSAGRLLGAAPLFAQQTWMGGRVLRLVGSGEVCSDYTGVLAEPGREAVVAEALADALVAQSGGEHGWDEIELCGIEAADRPTALFAAALAARGHAVDVLPSPCCWRIALPDTWEGYLARLSRNRRRQVRRMERSMIESGRARLHTVERPEDLGPAMERLIALHTLRRRRLGERGAFASARFAAFHAEIARTLLDGGRLHLHWLEVDGRPVAAEYDIAGGDVLYAYQSGIDPQALAIEPGSLMNVLVLRRAIDMGFQHYDYLRGDEPYKSHWRAEPRGCVHLRISAPNWRARLRRGARRLLERMKTRLRPQSAPSKDQP